LIAQINRVSSFEVSVAVIFRHAQIFRQILSDFQDLHYTILAVSPKETAMPARANPDALLTDEHQRAQRIFARLMGGEAMRAIAASENLSLRRVQQIVREQLDRRNANPADDFALLQIARLERALELIGTQIDSGKASAAHAYVRILTLLNRIAPDRLRLTVPFQSVTRQVDMMEDRLARLDAAREALALRHASEKLRENSAKRNGLQALDIAQNREMPDSPPLMISET
jgi:hypothetical protein